MRVVNPCPYCGYNLNDLRWQGRPGEPGWSLNPENNHTEYQCVCGNITDETEQDDYER